MMPKFLFLIVDWAEYMGKVPNFWKKPNIIKTIFMLIDCNLVDKTIPRQNYNYKELGKFNFVSANPVFNVKSFNQSILKKAKSDR